MVSRERERQKREEAIRHAKQAERIATFLAAGLSVRQSLALVRSGFTDFDEVAATPDEVLREKRHVGPDTLRRIQEARMR